MKRDYEAIYKLQEDVEEGRKYLYLFGSPIEVEVWYDCFFAYEWSKETQKDEVYYSVEGKTKAGKYFNIKSTDAIAKRIIIK